MGSFVAEDLTENCPRQTCTDLDTRHFNKGPIKQPLPTETLSAISATSFKVRSEPGSLNPQFKISFVTCRAMAFFILVSSPLYGSPRTLAL